VFKTNIDMVATHCAVIMCEGRAQQVVTDFLERTRRLPLKKELFLLLDQQLGIVDSDSESGTESG
jgi:hypothetical protein